MQEPTKEHYTFIGWFEDEDFEVLITQIDTSRGEELNLYAQWEAIDYTVTYHLDGGTNSESNPTSYTVEDKDIILQSPSKEHYTFLGWFEDEDFELPITQINTSRCENINLYAKWQAIDYTVTYHLDGGTNSESNPQTYTVEDIDITLQEPTKEHYTFVGWFEDEDFEVLITQIDTSRGEELNLYAQWEAIDYTIAYHLDGGINNEGNPTSYTIEDEDITLQSPTKEHYTFVGWFEDNKFETPIAEIDTSRGEDINLYAQWQAIDYIVTYHLDGGTNSESNPTSYTVEDGVITLQIPTKQHYDFLGWYADGEFNNLVTEIETSKGGNLNLYAKWTLTNYKITYHLDNGTNNESNPQTYTVEDIDITLQSPSKEHYTFIGWFEDEEFEVSIDEIDTSRGEELNLYAKWEAIDYTIAYHLDGGINNEGNPTSYTVEDGVITLQSPSKEHDTFLGWFEDEDFEVSITQINTSRGENINLYAKWTLTNYKITYYLDGGENSEENPHTYTIMDEDIILKTPTKTGFVFIGWFTNNTYNEGITEIKTSQGGNIKVYAQWEAIPYSVSYVLPEGVENSVDNPTGDNFTYGDYITLSAPTKIPENSLFVGWFIEEEGGEPIIDGVTVRGDTVIYARILYTDDFEDIYIFSDGTITGIKNEYKNISNIVIPSTINGQTVTAIGSNAFALKVIETITIPTTVTTFHTSAFSNCLYLKSITWTCEQKTNPMQNVSFYNCNALEYIILNGTTYYLWQININKPYYDEDDIFNLFFNLPKEEFDRIREEGEVIPSYPGTFFIDNILLRMDYFDVQINLDYTTYNGELIECFLGINGDPNYNISPGYGGIDYDLPLDSSHTETIIYGPFEEAYIPGEMFISSHANLHISAESNKIYFWVDTYIPVSMSTFGAESQLIYENGEWIAGDYFKEGETIMLRIVFGGRDETLFVWADCVCHIEIHLNETVIEEPIVKAYLESGEEITNDIQIEQTYSNERFSYKVTYDNETYEFYNYDGGYFRGYSGELTGWVSLYDLANLPSPYEIKLIFRKIQT